jgi:histidine ammonia-lyase
VERVYQRVRDQVPPLEADRPLTPDIERIAVALAREAFA